MTNVRLGNQVLGNIQFDQEDVDILAKDDPLSTIVRALRPSEDDPGSPSLNNQTFTPDVSLRLPMCLQNSIPSQVQQKSKTNLFALATEILEQIFRNLGYNDSICLGLASRVLYSIHRRTNGFQRGWLYCTYAFRLPLRPLHTHIRGFMGPDYRFCHRHLKFVHRDKWQECNVEWKDIKRLGCSF
jgi:hypothetical protein